MAQRPSLDRAPLPDEELQLRKRARRRLVGAAALVVLMVVFLPMVLDGQPRIRPQDVSVQIPPVPMEHTAPSILPGQVVPAAPPPSAAVVPSAPPPGLSAGMGPAPAPLDPAAPAAAVPAPKPPPAGPAAAADNAPGAHRGFVIPVGAFSNAQTAHRLRDHLRASKLPSYVETVKTAAGERTRVRVGPFATQEEANAVVARLDRLNLVSAHGLKVVPASP